MVDVREEEEISYRWHRRYVFAAVPGVIITVLALLFTLGLRNVARSLRAAVHGSPIGSREMLPTGSRVSLYVNTMTAEQAAMIILYRGRSGIVRNLYLWSRGGDRSRGTVPAASWEPARPYREEVG